MLLARALPADKIPASPCKGYFLTAPNVLREPYETLEGRVGDEQEETEETENPGTDGADSRRCRKRGEGGSSSRFLVLRFRSGDEAVPAPFMNRPCGAEPGVKKSKSFHTDLQVPVSIR